MKHILIEVPRHGRLDLLADLFKLPLFSKIKHASELPEEYSEFAVIISDLSTPISRRPGRTHSHRPL